jgi:hypothetical protein
MEFLRLLEIDRSLVTPEAQKSLLLADRVWNEEGCPQEACALCGVLEKILRRCLDFEHLVRAGTLAAQESSRARQLAAARNRPRGYPGRHIRTRRVSW